ncbi:UBP1-associated proteins 1C [Linum perenne]
MVGTWKKKMECLLECFPYIPCYIIVSSADGQTIIATPPDVVGEEAVAPAPALPAQTWRCYLCDVKVAREEILNAHLSGKHHRKKLTNQLLKMEERRSSVGSVMESFSPHVITTVKRTGESGWVCLLCDASCTCKSNLVDHLIGKKHAANANARMHI